MYLKHSVWHTINATFQLVIVAIVLLLFFTYTYSGAISMTASLLAVVTAGMELGLDLEGGHDPDCMT